MEAPTFLLLTLLCLLSKLSQSANILFFFPGGNYSHKVSIWPLVKALAERGHNVTFVSSNEKQPFPIPSVLDISPSYMVRATQNQYHSVDRFTLRLKNEGNAWFSYNRDTLRHCERVFTAVKEDDNLNRIFLRNSYDLIVNNLFYGECSYPLIHRVIEEGGKAIIYDSSYVICWLGEIFGFPAETAWIPDGPSVSDFPMNFYDRLYNYLVPIQWHIKRHWELYPPMERMVQTFFPTRRVPPAESVMQNASLVFVASHPTTDYARSLPPFMINIGGMQCWQNRSSFQGEFKDFLDNAIGGAVLIAFGSTIDLSKMPENFKMTFFRVIEKFPDIQFIWRWEGPLPEHHPKNLKVSNWLPQYDILGHPNLKAFVSHGGLNSLTEATCQGVPVVVLPLFADQDYNAYRAEANQVGVRLEARTLTPPKMENALREVLTNNKYAVNMKRLSKAALDRAMNPVAEAVYWSEFVIRHNDTSSLKPLNKLLWYQRRMIDVFAALAFAAAIVTIFLVLLLRYLVSRFLYIGDADNSITSKAKVPQDKLRKLQKTKRN